MSESLYELAFYGRLVDGVSLDTAKGNVATLFKASTAQVEKMFAGGRVVIRNKLDKATGDKYVAVMRKNGLVCELDPMGGAAKVAPNAAQTKPQAGPASGPSDAAASTPRQAPSTPNTSPAASPSAAKGSQSAKGFQSAKGSQPANGQAESSELKVLPLPSGFSASEQTETGRPAGFNLAGEDVDDILQQSHLNLDPEGVRLSEHQEVEAPVFSELDSITIAPTGSDLVDKKDELPPIVPDTSGITIAPVGSDMGQIKNDESIDVPDLSHLKVDDLPDNQ